MSNRLPADFPVAHDARKEARRRLTVGLAGLFVMLLLVLLAGYLTGAARQEAETAKAQAEAAGVSNPGGGATALPSPTEPLGNVPVSNGSADDLSSGLVPVVPTGDGGVVVPDLEPDPQLEAAKSRP